jgi:hypothetical protein
MGGEVAEMSASREKLDRLIRRRDWLELWITKGEYSGKDLAHDKAEASALNWAISILGRFVEDEEAKAEGEKEGIGNG